MESLRIFGWNDNKQYHENFLVLECTFFQIFHDCQIITSCLEEASWISYCCGSSRFNIRNLFGPFQSFLCIFLHCFTGIADISNFLQKLKFCPTEMQKLPHNWQMFFFALPRVIGHHPLHWKAVFYSFKLGIFDVSEMIMK